MAQSYNKFNCFIGDVFNEVHDLVGTGGSGADTLKVYLSNATPDAATDTQKSELAEISNENGYTAPEDTTNVGAMSTGTLTVQGDAITITASGGTVGPFQYVVLYNDTATNDELVAWWDYGSAITLSDGESFTIKFNSEAGTGTIFTAS